MRVVIQRVSEGRVEVDGDVVGRCGHGFVLLVGVAHDDTVAEAERLAGKTARLRVFPDDEGRFDRSLVDVGGEALVVSQFTLLADTSAGNRPGFSGAAHRGRAEHLYEHFCQTLRGMGIHVETGVFGARMQVALVNDGPVTLILDT